MSLIEPRRTPETMPGLLEIIEDIQRSAAALRAKFDSWSWTGANPIAELSHLAVLVRKYPEEARRVLAQLETADGDQTGRGLGGGEAQQPRGRGQPLWTTGRR